MADININPTHFKWCSENGVATITLDRPDRKNPLTFDSYAELRDTFRQLNYVDEVKSIIFTGAGDNFCSGGDVHDIIAPLVKMDMPELLDFTRMTGDLVKAMRECPQPIIAAVDGICAGAGACIAMASDIRYGTARSKVAFLFNRVGLAGCDMGACAILPRIIGHGRASELLYTGRTLQGPQAESWGFFNSLVEPEDLYSVSEQLALRLANGPTFANSMTKMMLNKEWNMGINEFIEAEAQAQAICMKTNDFERAYQAFVLKEKPSFKGD
ncbi:MAG: enoyl-CoA hydratase family protein [Pseudomonadota bacterium]|nr:enoyl-CoA hydratase family protein [Pseudomonadota bacterium]